MISVAAIILTFNEECHIERAIASIAHLTSEIYVIDSFSSDRTVALAQSAGATVLLRKFSSHSDQFNWALANVGTDAEWILRLDADEYLEPDLINNLVTSLPAIDADIKGINLRRKHVFMGRWIRHGGRYPLVLLRIWCRWFAVIEDRLMDEHVTLLEGRTITIAGGFVDHNLKPLSSFISKHIDYANREATEVLIDRYQLLERVHARHGSWQVSTKRWLKNKIYNRLPLWAGPFLYFVLRYVFQLGILDGKEGQIYHVLQGFCYRFIVACKVEEYDRNLRHLDDSNQRLGVLRTLSGLWLATPSRSG